MPKRTCPVCGSKQWHKQQSSGLIACEEGHVLQGYRDEAAEAEDLGPHAMKKRAMKSERVVKEKSKIDVLLYHGPRARFHYYQCLQLILRLQIKTLTQFWELPPEFEVLCRDVWALHLSLLPNPPPAEPYFFAQNGGTKSRDTNTRPASGSGIGEKSSPESSETNSEQDIARLMEQASETDGSSSSDSTSCSQSSNSASASNTERKPRKTRKKRNTPLYESPASTLTVLVAVCWLLRLPVTYMDLIRLVESYTLPLLDPLRLLPPQLTRHLSKHTTQALTPQHAPKVEKLHSSTSRLAKLMYARFEVQIPNMNAAPMIWRAIRSLGGGPTLYALTKRLARVLELPMTLHASLTPVFLRGTTYAAGKHKYDGIPAEVACVAAALVTLKLVYGLDGRTRVVPTRGLNLDSVVFRVDLLGLLSVASYLRFCLLQQSTDRLDRSPKEVNDPATCLPRLGDYIAYLRESNLEDGENPDAKFSAQKNLGVLFQTDETVDSYLDFCERALISGDQIKGKRDLLADYFPLRTETRHREMPKHNEDYPNFQATTIIEDGEDNEMLAQGESYAIYSAADILGTLPEVYEVVLRRGATWCGVDTGYLGSILETYEIRLHKWWETTKRE